MKRALVGGVLTGLLVIAGMIWLLSTWEPPPVIPDDPMHGAARRANCAECHGVDGPVPRTKNHPLNDQCFQCHVRPGQEG